MKKVLTSCITALLLILLLTGCREADFESLTVKELLEAGYTDFDDSYELKINATVTASSDGSVIEFPVEKSYKLVIKEDGTVITEEITTVSTGFDITITTYTEDDYAYTVRKYTGVSYQSKRPAEKAFPNLHILPSYFDANGKLTIDEADATICDNEDGTKAINLPLAGESAKALSIALLRAYMGVIDVDNEAFTFDDTMMTYTVDSDGTVLGFETTVNLVISDESLGYLKAVIHIPGEYVHSEEAVVINPPKGYLDFPEEDEDLL